MKNNFSKFTPLIVFLIVIIGLFLRFYKISDIFSDVDDISPITLPYLLEQGEQKTVSLPFNFSFTVTKDTIKTNPFLYAGMVSKLMTYAPLQYLFFPAFLSGDYPYREFLLRGRLPSAIFGCLALLMFCLFYKKYNGTYDAAGLFGISLFSFSLMNILYSQQTLSYAVGVFSAATLLYLLESYRNKEKTIGNLIFLSFSMMLLSYSNYQIIVLVPAMYVVLFCVDAFEKRKVKLGTLIVKYGVSFAVYCFLMVPLYFLFLRDKVGVGHFHGGIPGFENFFPHFQSEGLLGRIFYTLRYLFASLFVVIETNVSFSTNETIMNISAILAFALFLLGAFALFYKKEEKNRIFGVFISLVAIIWVIMNFKGQFPLSPTRHVLLLTPFILFVLIAGTKYILESLKTRKIIGEYAVLSLVFLITIIFFTGYVSVREERKDRFDEDKIERIMISNNLDTIVGYEFTYNPLIMFKKSNKHYRFVRWEPVGRHAISESSLPAGSFMLISHSKPIEGEKFIYDYLISLGYKIRHITDLKSDVQVGISNKIKYYTNGLYISIADR